MIICVDARPLVEKKVGFGYFLQNMLEEILELDTTNKYILLSDRVVYFDISKYRNVKVVQYKTNFFFRKTFYYYFILPKFLKENSIKPDVFWGTNHIMPVGFSKGVKKILTIHDFTHKKFPKSTTKFNLLISRLFFAKSIENSDCIICISKNTEKELAGFYSKECKHKTITTIYEGGYSRRDLVHKTVEISNIRNELRKYDQKRYILFVGTIEPRKNIQLLINAAPKLKGFVEVIVCGKIGWESKEVISKLDSTDNLKYFNYISQDEKNF
jgi:glycosyltransferase involved in cell wall biosynthesis